MRFYLKSMSASLSNRRNELALSPSLNYLWTKNVANPPRRDRRDDFEISSLSKKKIAVWAIWYALTAYSL